MAAKVRPLSNDLQARKGNHQLFAIPVIEQHRGLLILSTPADSTHGAHPEHRMLDALANTQRWRSLLLGLTPGGGL